jgi:uncharacterized membrane protein YjfL (UPF0719 family)
MVAAIMVESRSTILNDLWKALNIYQMLATLIYSVIGMLIFGVAFWVFNKLMPFSVRKEIEEDQNTALGIIIGSFLIGLAGIIASAMH